MEGIAVSPGVVTGRARLVRRSDNHAHVLPGEILVAPFTDPAWTPYFVSAAGVVMDRGGVRSHGIIVAREYGLPAVTNLGSATQLIRTGDLIQVDGDAGRVTILDRGGKSEELRRPGKVADGPTEDLTPKAVCEIKHAAAGGNVKKWPRRCRTRE